MVDPSEQQVLLLFVRNQARIRGFVLSLLGDVPAAEDVIQETFLVIQRKASEFRPDSNFVAWAFQIARFQVMRAQENHQRELSRFSDETLESLAASVPERPFDELKLSALHGCLTKLAPQARRIVDLFYEGEHRPGQIARILSWNPTAVSVALCRARRFLRQCIEHQVKTSTP